MKLTIAAQKKLDALAEVTSVQDLATIIGLAERFAKANGMARIATVHIEAAMERMATDTDGTMWQAEWDQATKDTYSFSKGTCLRAPDYDAVAEAAILDAAIAYNEAMAMAQNEPTSQIEDSRDAAEVVG